ncbi:hypothetical protein NFI96_032288 [Prochilodus magdalenae]|nr:hypothetical protein NFI96_032288 [Prochilodus magdalenae]
MGGGGAHAPPTPTRRALLVAMFVLHRQSRLSPSGAGEGARSAPGFSSGCLVTPVLHRPEPNPGAEFLPSGPGLASSHTQLAQSVCGWTVYTVWSTAASLSLVLLHQIRMAFQQISSLLRIHHRAVFLRLPSTAAISVTVSGVPRFFSATKTTTAPPNGSENVSLLENLTVLGVDLKMARQRQPGVLRKIQTNEHGLSEFLSRKGASRDVIASIISRFPRAITRSGEHLEERWQLWRSIFQDDAEIVRILDRSPESFFRSSDNENLEKNIRYLNSLGITPQDLPKLLTKAPRVFSNSFELNRTMVELLQSVCVSLGGTDHEGFARAIIFRNVYILIRSTKRVKANIEFLLASLKLSNAEALSLFQSHGADILDLSHTSLKRNFKSLWAKLKSLGCRKAEMKRLVLNYALVLFVSPATLNEKLDCLVEGGIDVKQIVEKPKVLDFSAATLKQRLSDLNSLGYNFHASGIAILDMSRKRFDAKFEKLREFGH